MLTQLTRGRVVESPRDLVLFGLFQIEMAPGTDPVGYSAVFKGGEFAVASPVFVSFADPAAEDVLWDLYVACKPVDSTLMSDVPGAEVEAVPLWKFGIEPPEQYVHFGSDGAWDNYRAIMLSHHNPGI